MDIDNAGLSGTRKVRVVRHGQDRIHLNIKDPYSSAGASLNREHAVQIRDELSRLLGDDQSLTFVTNVIQNPEAATEDDGLVLIHEEEARFRSPLSGETFPVTARYYAKPVA